MDKASLDCGSKSEDKGGSVSAATCGSSTVSDKCHAWIQVCIHKSTFFSPFHTSCDSTRNIKLQSYGLRWTMQCSPLLKCKALALWNGDFGYGSVFFPPKTLEDVYYSHPQLLSAPLWPNSHLIKNTFVNVTLKLSFILVAFPPPIGEAAAYSDYHCAFMDFAIGSVFQCVTVTRLAFSHTFSSLNVFFF